MFNKISYIKYGEKSKRAVINQKEVCVEEVIDDLEKIQLAEEEEEENELKLYFESVVVNEDLNPIKTKMRETIEFREKMIKNRSTKFGQIFPMYFTHPILVNITTNTYYYLFIFNFSQNNFLDSI